MVKLSYIGCVLGALLAMYFGYTPFWLYRTIATIIFTVFGAVVPEGPQDDGSLKEAMRNVTRDYEQVRYAWPYSSPGLYSSVAVTCIAYSAAINCVWGLAASYHCARVLCHELHT